MSSILCDLCCMIFRNRAGNFSGQNAVGARSFIQRAALQLDFLELRPFCRVDFSQGEELVAQQPAYVILITAAQQVAAVRRLFFVVQQAPGFICIM